MGRGGCRWWRRSPRARSKEEALWGGAILDKHSKFYTFCINCNYLVLSNDIRSRLFKKLLSRFMFCNEKRRV